MIDRVHRELTDADIRKIADTYHAWRGDPSTSSTKRSYHDIPGFCKSATLDDIRHHGHILTPGRYVGAAEVEDDGEPFEEKMEHLAAKLREQTDQSTKLDELIWANLKDLGYGG
jgi:type I restriction enzyme M protein